MPFLSGNIGSMAAVCLLGVLFMASPVAAFGAGNIAQISKIEGLNWRHGDIEDALLALSLAASVCGGRARKFSKTDVKRVYFGNWLRDYSQAVDTAALKMVSVDAVNLLVWMLGFFTFGYATREFEVTGERLGCYRPEEHIDNPKGYGVGLDDARDLDRRLRGPVDEERELAIDEQTGMKVYIAAEGRGITTSAEFVRNTFKQSIECARRYARDQNESDLHEALRLLGSGLHCLEDFSAHSNYVELSLIELGEEDIFPHVGSNTKIDLDGARDQVYPLVTGTFGGVDFLHSVMGEVSDKATQSEIQELENTFDSSRRQDTSSFLKKILSQLPPGVIGGDQAEKMDRLSENAAAAGIENMQLDPKDPEQFTRQVQQLLRDIRPILEFHDELMRTLSEKLALVQEFVENFQDQLNMFVFSLIAPYILPVIRQMKSELKTGSTEVIESSRQEQLNVFEDDYCTDPTHSMLSKDHFSNVLNTPAGRVASAVVKWTVPQLMECWDDENADVDYVLDRIISGVFHHPAQRDQGIDEVAQQGRQRMFAAVEEWWSGMSRRDQSEMRDRLSPDGVRNARNHLEDVHDCGHGCGKPLAMARLNGKGKDGGNSALAQMSSQAMQNAGTMASEAVGGGFLGSVMGTLIGGVGGGLLSGAVQTTVDDHFANDEAAEDEDHKKSYGSHRQKESSSRHYRNEDEDESSRYERNQYSSHHSRSRNDEYTTDDLTGAGDPYGSHHHRDEYAEGSGSYGNNNRGFRDEDSSRTDYGRRGARDDEYETSYGRRDNRDDEEDSRSHHHSSHHHQSSYRNEDEGDRSYSRRNDDEDNYGSYHQSRRGDYDVDRNNRDGGEAYYEGSRRSDYESESRDHYRSGDNWRRERGDDEESEERRGYQGRW